MGLKNLEVLMKNVQIIPHYCEDFEIYYGKKEQKELGKILTSVLSRFNLTNEEMAQLSRYVYSVSSFCNKGFCPKKENSANIYCGDYVDIKLTHTVEYDALIFENIHQLEVSIAFLKDSTIEEHKIDARDVDVPKLVELMVLFNSLCKIDNLAKYANKESKYHEVYEFYANILNAIASGNYAELEPCLDYIPQWLEINNRNEYNWQNLLTRTQNTASLKAIYKGGCINQKQYLKYKDFLKHIPFDTVKSKLLHELES